MSFMLSPSFFLTINPGRELPKAIEIMLARTETDMIPGMETGLNQLLARIDGELRTKILPIAASTDPVRHQKIFWYSIKVLIQTPAMSKTPPMPQPSFIPNLSRIQLAGKANIGWKIGKNNTFRVTSTEL